MLIYDEKKEATIDVNGTNEIRTAGEVHVVFFSEDRGLFNQTIQLHRCYLFTIFLLLMEAHVSNLCKEMKKITSLRAALYSDEFPDASALRHAMPQISLITNLFCVIFFLSKRLIKTS